MNKAPLLLLLLPSLALADEVYLEGAGMISGRITERTATMVLIDNGDGIVGVPLDRVERIVEGRTPLDEYDERASRLRPEDFRAWRTLGRWAAEAGISKQSRLAYEQVLEFAPHDAEAREALGFVQLDGRWVTEAESYRARGFVEYEGEWMTPAEVQMIEQAAEADQARRDAELRAVDAEIAAAQAEQRAEEAEERAEEAEEDARGYQYQNPVYLGGWGYGVNYWPAGSTTVTRRSNVYSPSRAPARGPR